MRRARRLCDDGLIDGSAPLKATTVSYSLNLEEVELIDGSKISTTLSKAGSPDLSFEVVILEDGVLRFVVDELQPIKERYRVKDVVIEDNLILATEGISLSKGEDFAKIKLWDTHVLHLTATPFRAELLNSSEEVVLQLNSRDLLSLEPMRHREDAFKRPLCCGCFPIGGSKSQSLPAKGDWEESWGRGAEKVVDSKPDGPSAVSLDLAFPASRGLYGLPERASLSTALADTSGKGGATSGSEPYRLFNADVFAYPIGSSKGLYGCVPMVLGRGKRQPFLACFWNNASDTFVDVVTDPVDDGEKDCSPTKTVHFISESGVADLFVMLGPSVEDVYRQYAVLTGFPPLPPIFALGLHQSRWNYFSEDEVVEVDFGYEVVGVPLDSIWLDIEHTLDKRYLEWDENKFPDPSRLHARLGSRGRKLVTIADPHLKADAGYSLYREANEHNMLVIGSKGTPFKGQCWPGESTWLDFASPEVRAWWTQVVANSLLSTNLWIDMNEPAAFEPTEKSLPKDVLHVDGVEHRHLHNLYGFYMQMASYDALRVRGSNDERPFLLSRSFFAGSQRFGAVWTGDNESSWSHLRASIPMLLSLNMCGISFCGADVGGYFKDPPPDLFLRWVQLGAFLPFFRIHSHKDTQPREIFKQDSDLIPLFREAVQRRYSLLPYWYTLFYTASTTGLPVIRPLWMMFPDCPLIGDEETAFMVGDALLVAPIVEEDQTQSLTIPLPTLEEDGVDCWFDLSPPHRRIRASDSDPFLLTPLPLSAGIPAFIRAGKILPLLNSVEGASSTEDLKTSGLAIIVALNGLQEAVGTLFQDDQVSFKYQTENALVLRSLKMSNGILKATSINSEESKYHSRTLVERIVILNVAKAPLGALVTMTTVREQTSRSDTPEEREGNVIHSRSTVAVMTRKFTTQKTVPLIYDKDAQSVVVKGLAVEASFDWDLKLL